MKRNRNGRLYLVDPRTIWELWKVLHIYTGKKIRRNPPSSGFIGESMVYWTWITDACMCQYNCITMKLEKQNRNKRWVLKYLSIAIVGLALLLPYCAYVDVVEYMPSTRLNGRCHYYDNEVLSILCVTQSKMQKIYTFRLQIDPACTFGAWHPLAAEKIMSFNMSSANNFAVFQQGHLRIRQPQRNVCQQDSN